MSSHNISDDDMNRLRDHVRLLHGLEVQQKVKRSRRYSSESAITPRANKTYVVRKQCTKKRIKIFDRYENEIDELDEIKKIHKFNLIKKRGDFFKLNKAFHMRWKKIRKLPVIHSYFRDTFLDTGKPPFVVPVHYKPFNVYWDADWAKQEFIFLDASSEEKKKEKEKENNAKNTLEVKEIQSPTEISKPDDLNESTETSSTKDALEFEKEK
ncbi:hypothetical protein PGB90_004971 [Kerria lacca]